MTASVPDQAALGKLLDEHRPRLLAMVQRRLDPTLAPRLDPEDILAEAYLEARRKWARFQDQSGMTPYAWLYRITLDCLIQAWRHATRGGRDPRREMPFPEGTSIQLGLGLVSPGTSPSSAVARKELQERVQKILGLLKDQDREILWMRHFDELSFPEAALVLGITENAATLRYVHALRRIKDLWQQLHGDRGFEV